jgi:hypothetical protein
MPYLIQLLLPRNCGSESRPAALFQQVREELNAKFGGVTVYSQSPAEGLWTTQGQEVVRDEIVLFEVMAKKLSRRWWRGYRRELEQRFEQTEIVARAQKIKRL